MVRNQLPAQLVKQAYLVWQNDFRKKIFFNVLEEFKFVILSERNSHCCPILYNIKTLLWKFVRWNQIVKVDSFKLGLDPLFSHDFSFRNYNTSSNTHVIIKSNTVEFQIKYIGGYCLNFRRSCCQIYRNVNPSVCQKWLNQRYKYKQLLQHSQVLH